MRIIEFKYPLYKNVKIPIINLEIKGNGLYKTILGFVDSGATFSILHSDESERLDIEYKKGIKTSVKVGDGNYIPVYIHKLDVKIEDVKFKADIGFSNKLGVEFNLIGRKDIFEKFRICFDDKE